MLFLATIQNKEKDSCEAWATILMGPEEIPMKLKIDIEEQVNFISEAEYRKNLAHAMTLTSSVSVRVVGYGGHPLHILQKSNVKCRYKEKC